jgi:hypothetical protein
LNRRRGVLADLELPLLSSDEIFGGKHQGVARAALSPAVRTGCTVATAGRVACISVTVA